MSMDISLITLIIGCTLGLLSSSEAQFPFQTGPVLFDPYSSLFSSTELNPFESTDMHIAVPAHRHTHPHPYPKRPVDKHQPKPYGKIVEHRDYHKKLYESEPSKWRKYSRTSFLREVPNNRNHKKLLIPVPKFNNINKGFIRPRPESGVDSLHKHNSYERNNLNPKPVINYKNQNNYKNSNGFRDLVPRKPIKTLSADSYSSDDSSDKRTDRDSDEDQSNVDIELSADEDNEEQFHNRNRNSNRGEGNSTPKHLTTFKPFNYHVKERAYTFDSTQPKRPALYEIEPPKNLDRNRPLIKGPGYIQKIPVPHNTLMEIAEISGPPRPQTSRRPHPFEGFHQNSRPKQESEIIVNSLGDGMTRQVGASMSVQLEDRKFQPKGKIFDEPIGNSDRRPAADSRQQQDFRPDERNPFNSKHFDSFATKGFHNNNEFRAINSLKNDESPYPHISKAEHKSDDDDYDEGVSDSPEESSEPPKPMKNFFNDQPKKPQSQPLRESRPQSRTPEPEQSEPEGEDSEEWHSSGIPGSPGKDYPMLSGVHEKSDFSCVQRPHGFYADVSQKCQVYHQCSSQGSQKFLCPNGTLFSQESLVCDWWYNVLCENSEKLYHKNAQLYRPDNRRQNEEMMSNDENRQNHNQNRNEYNKSWNFQNNNNNNNNNFRYNDNRNDNHNQNNHNNYNNNYQNNYDNNHNRNPHNHSPHNHYSNNNSRAHSGGNRAQAPSKAPELEYDEEIDVDLNNDESKNSFIKVLSNQPNLVLKLKPLNKNKNLGFLT